MKRPRGYRATWRWYRRAYVKDMSLAHWAQYGLAKKPRQWAAAEYGWLMGIEALRRQYRWWRFGYWQVGGHFGVLSYRVVVEAIERRRTAHPSAH